MEYNFREIEKEIKQFWKEKDVYKVTNDTSKPKYYVLDMFPYPSGAGLHVGHPLGYIASDIFARYKVMKGFNVLHPMGFDAFGLPAEQYALETGQHPAVTTEKNIARYKEQLDNIGFNYDWSREVRTSDEKYYKWTQWIFLQLFKSWFNRKEQKAQPIETLIKIFEQDGNANYPAPDNDELIFTAQDWLNENEEGQRDILMHYRLAYLDFAEVWWCEALATVLANDEVVNGVSERGGHPVEKRKMRQWFLRITEFADRLQDSLNNLDWSEAMKEMQRNWIGKSEGAEIDFYLTQKLSPQEHNDLTPNPSPKERGTSDSDKEVAIIPNYYTTDAGAWKANIDKAKEMRHNPTEAENILWQQIRNKQLGYKFRRQHPVLSFIPDFLCLEKKLIIEIDGEYHNQQEEYDTQRTAQLEQAGYTVIRFSNNEVVNNTTATIQKIKNSLAELQSYNDTEDEDDAHGTLSFGEGRGEVIKVFTTRPDTIFGVDFIVLAPEHDLVNSITTDEQKAEIEKYVAYVKSRSERERMAEKKISGCFTGAYAVHTFSGKEIPVWISEYVLAGYGTGAIMAVPAGDERDHAFAQYFNIPITNIFGEKYTGENAVSDKNVTIENSDFISGLNVKDAATKVLTALEEKRIGKRKINYKMRDAGFSRQRYWGEPFPIVYAPSPLGRAGEGLIPYAIDEPQANLKEQDKQLPLQLPYVESYKPGPNGEGPLANIESFVKVKNKADETLLRETNTMPGYAGSSWYFLRYMDNQNDEDFADRKATDYWNQVDLYVGGTEHAVGHLLYSRMWTKVLYDLGYLSFDEPFKRLVNQGMIGGNSRLIYRFVSHSHDYNKSEINEDINQSNIENQLGFPIIFFSYEYYQKFLTGEKDMLIIEAHKIINDYNKSTQGSIVIALADDLSLVPIHVDVSLVDGVELKEEEFKKWREEYKNAKFVSESGKYICGTVLEKMSKRYYNVVNPDDIVVQYGADTFRMYEMFLGPIEMSKPWDTKGIEGVHRFLRKFWRLFYDEQKGWLVTDEQATEPELKVLHKSIKKIEEDTERFSFNTAVSQFMICVNELTDLSCHKSEILNSLVRLITPYAPHIAEYLWKGLGNNTSIVHTDYPTYEEKYVTENSKVYPVAINGKPRTELEFPLDASQTEIEEKVLANDIVQKWLEGKAPKKIIFVKGRMINVVM